MSRSISVACQVSGHPEAPALAHRPAPEALVAAVATAEWVGSTAAPTALPTRPSKGGERAGATGGGQVSAGEAGGQLFETPRQDGHRAEGDAESVPPSAATLQQLQRQHQPDTLLPGKLSPPLTTKTPINFS